MLNAFKLKYYNWYKISLITFWTICSGAFLFLLFMAGNKQDNLLCKEINITIKPIDLHFYNRSMVMNLVTKSGSKNAIEGKPLNKLNTQVIEEQIKQEPYIENAKVYETLNGELNIELNQRTPLLRMVTYEGDQFYVDKHGIKMPISRRYTHPVLIANGNIFERYDKGDSLYSYGAKELYKIATYVDNDAFLKAQIEQIFVSRDYDFILAPKVGDHLIVLGDANNLDNKFTKLKVFYKEGLNRTGWSKYKIINLSYKNQVVCTKN